MVYPRGSHIWIQPAKAIWLLFGGYLGCVAHRLLSRRSLSLARAPRRNLRSFHTLFVLGRRSLYSSPVNDVQRPLIHHVHGHAIDLGAHDVDDVQICLMGSSDSEGEDVSVGGVRLDGAGGDGGGGGGGGISI